MNKLTNGRHLPKINSSKPLLITINKSFIEKLFSYLSDVVKTSHV